MQTPRPAAFFLATLAAMAALHWLAPGPPLVSRDWRWLIPPLGVAGAALVLGCGWMSDRRRADASRPDGFAAEGPFRFSRNPVYLGFALALLGAWLDLGSAASLAPALGFWALANWLWIPREEREMAERFGEDYDAYRARVRRWI